jgi:hypothetical protein
LGGEVRREVRHILGAELCGNRVHQGVLARALLERLELPLQIAGALSSEVRNAVAHAHPDSPVTGGTDCLRLHLSGGSVGSLDGGREGECGGQGEQPFHGFSPWGGNQAVNRRCAGFIPGAGTA